MTTTEIAPMGLIGKRVRLVCGEDLPEPDEITLEGQVTGFSIDGLSDNNKPSLTLLFGDVRVDTSKWRLIE